jgi:hypothetical protein
LARSRILALLPLGFLTGIGFVIALAVLLDTFIVRRVLLPALVLEIGPRMRWPPSDQPQADHHDEPLKHRSPRALQLGGDRTRLHRRMRQGPRMRPLLGRVDHRSP